MRLPIPDDWNGQDWECVQIQWPSSDKWLAILAGFITLTGRGWTWNESTGSVIATQAIGRLIDDLNLPFNTCTGERAPTIDTQYLYHLLESEESDFNMTLCGYNPKAFKIEGGILYVRDFCGDWVAIGGINTAPDEQQFPQIPDIDTEETDISPCGMAWAVSDFIMELASYIWDESDNTVPVFMARKAENHMNMDLWDFATINAANQALIMKGAVIITGGVLVDLERSDVIEAANPKEIACAVLPAMGYDGSVNSQLLWDSLYSWLSKKYTITTSGNNPFIWNYYSEVFSSIGKGSMADIAIGGMFDTTRSCDCSAPETGETSPTINGWYLGAYRSVREEYAGQYNTKLCVPILDGHDVFGVVFEVTHAVTANNIKRMSATSASCAAYDFNAWNDSSDHLECAGGPCDYGCGPETVIDEIMGAGLYTHLGTGNYYNVTNPALPPIEKFKTAMHGFYMDGAEVGEWYTIRMRPIHNTNSPSHA